ncbi:MAG: exodeoxyribonuclease beta subunit [Campylobacterota bacterium]|nr:exodeoxyribonuclease beta subunit [Campylobacterota bacterium]
MFINNLAYEASAGSGKTFMLVVRYLSLLFKGASSSKILALTFTNKAANEMQERIVSTLEELEHRDELHEIAKVSELSREYILQNRQRVLYAYLNSNTKIMTIDSFFTQILRKFSLYASLMPDFSTFNAQHEVKLLLKFLKEVKNSSKMENLIALSLESSKRLSDIFEFLDEFYIKSQELSHIEFVKGDLEAHKINAMVLLEKLRAIVHSSHSASKNAINGVEAQNFDELCAKAWLGRDSLNYSTFAKCYTPSMDILLREIQEAIKSYHRAKEQNFFYALKELSDIYIQAKKALYMDDSELGFSDVTYLVYEILKLLDDSSFLYFRLDAQIEHILLDEFQDTSILQYEILRPLIEEITSGNGIFEGGSFFFVGDVKQSIYRFRGGVSELFAEVRKKHHTHLEKLLVNYRSKKEIVTFVNAVFRDKIKEYSDQLAKESSSGGFVEVIENDAILDEVVAQVKRVLQIGAREDEIAILCATNADGEEIKSVLQSSGIEVVTETTTKLINQKSIKAILEYLKYQYFMQDIYKYNFFALISQEVREMAKVDFTKKSLLEIVKEAVEEFDLFDEDFNIIKFLSEVGLYSDIEALLFEYERLQSSAATSELHGVRVLTVHKSKGLEFAHVIVMDRLKKAPPKRDAIIYEYDGIRLKNVYLRIKDRDELDNEYKIALQKEKILAYEDSLNALYVAFTRAKESLFVVKKSKDSSFEILNLTPSMHGDLLYYESKKTKKEAKNSNTFLYKSLRYGVQNEVLETQKEQKEDIQSIYFGLAMHYMLEMLRDFNLDSVKSATSLVLNKYGAILEEQDINDIQNRVSMLLKNEKFISLLNGSSYREKAIMYKESLRYIDLLVKCNDGVWNVIDYKSSLLFSDEHQKQVKFYVEAIEKITNQKARGYICYLLKNGIEIVAI